MTEAKALPAENVPALDAGEARQRGAAKGAVSAGLNLVPVNNSDQLVVDNTSAMNNICKNVVCPLLVQAYLEQIGSRR